MKIKNSELTGIVNFLSTFENRKLPQKISYAIMRNIILFSKEYQIYEQALVNLLNTYKDHMIKDDKGNIINDKSGIPLVEDCVKEDYGRELNDLFEIEVDINLYCIPESTFDYDDCCGKYDSLSPQEIFLLSNLLCEKGENEKGDI